MRAKRISREVDQGSPPLDFQTDGAQVGPQDPFDLAAL